MQLAVVFNLPWSGSELFVIWTVNPQYFQAPAEVDFSQQTAL